MFTLEVNIPGCNSTVLFDMSFFTVKNNGGDIEVDKLNLPKWLDTWELITDDKGF